MSQLPPGFVLDSAPAPAGQSSGPVYGAPPKPEKPDAPKTTWTQGVVNGKPVQISSEGKVEALPGNAGSDPNTLDPKTIDGQRNIAAGILKNSGVDLIGGKDPVSDLILQSTSGWLQSKAAAAYGGLTGDATDGMVAIGKLKPLLADMTLQMAGGSLGAQISDSDRKFIMERMGNIADPEVPAEQRLASWEQVKQRLAQMSGLEYRPSASQGGEEEGLTGSVTDDRPNEDPNAVQFTHSGPGGGAWASIGAGVGDLVEGGLNNTVGLITNPVSSVLGRAMGYEGYTGDIGQAVRDALQLPEGNQTAAAINQAAAGGFSLGALSSRGGVALGNQALRTFGNNPLLDAATGATAAASAETAKNMGAGPGGQAAAALAGGFAPSGVMAGRNALSSFTGRTPPRGPAPDMEVVQAGERQGVPIRQPDARPEMRGDFANLQTGQYAGPIVNQARAADTAVMEQRVQDIGGAGNASDPYALGSRVQAAGERYKATTRAQANRLYDRVRELTGQKRYTPGSEPITIDEFRAKQSELIERTRKASAAGSSMSDGDFTKTMDAINKEAEALNRRPLLEPGETTSLSVRPQKSVAVLDANIQELRAAGENTNSAAIKYLEGLRADIDRGLTVDAVQNLRSNMRGQISQNGLTGTDTDRRVLQVIDAMNADLAEQLPQEASTALRAADQFYRQRQEFINGTLEQFMGSRGNPLSPETAAQRLVSMTQGKGNFDRFSRMWSQLDEGERADVSATIAASLGRKANGDFSPATLIRSLDPRQGINPRTARLVFGEDGAKALNDLRIIAQAKTDTANALNNSRTGVMVNRASGGLRSLILGGLGFSASGPAGAVVAPLAEGILRRVGEERAARLMLNPDFTKWLRAMPEATNPRAINAYFDKLKVSAAKSQVVANDIEAFTGAVLDVFAKSPGRAAAQDEAPSGGKPPQQ